jgi:sulfate transport system permease protein
VRHVLIFVSIGFMTLFVILPLIALFGEALRHGLGAYVDGITRADTWVAVRLSLLVAMIAVPLNAVFGIAAAWTIGKHDFRGKALLVTLIDVPLSVSPVISGLLFVLLFGRSGIFGPWLWEHGIKVVFAVPGIVLATAFVTFPIVARELIPLMESQGREEELAARVLGASGWQTFFRVTLPNIRWALLYGLLVSAGRAMGEFGAVSVVSGHIRGETNTLPLHIEVLYDDYDFVGAFSAATLLAFFGLITLGIKTWVERRGHGA